MRSTAAASLHRVAPSSPAHTRVELERFKLAVDCATDHIVVTDPKGVVVYANQAAAQTTGYPVEEMVGKTPALWGGQMPTTFYRSFWDTIAVHRESYRGEIRNKRKDGVIYDAEIHVAPVLDRKGNIMSFVGIERDVTETKRLSRARTEFISLASHNIKTPLTTLSWYAEMLMNGDVGALTPSQREYVGEIRLAAKRMTDIVTSLLNISRLELGTFVASVEACEIAGIVRAALDEAAPGLRARQVSVSWYADHALAPVMTDRGMCEHIVGNLVSNACKYCREGGTVTAKVFHKPAGHEVYGKTFSDDRLVVLMGDEGIGIPEAEQRLVFTQFFRASNTTAVSVEGSGIGLYFVQEAVTALGGDVWFRSTPDVGTEFYVALPYQSPRLQ